MKGSAWRWWRALVDASVVAASCINRDKHLLLWLTLFVGWLFGAGGFDANPMRSSPITAFFREHGFKSTMEWVPEDVSPLHLNRYIHACDGRNQVLMHRRPHKLYRIILLSLPPKIGLRGWFCFRDREAAFFMLLDVQVQNPVRHDALHWTVSGIRHPQVANPHPSHFIKNYVSGEETRISTNLQFTDFPSDNDCVLSGLDGFTCFIERIPNVHDGKPTDTSCKDRKYRHHPLWEGVVPEVETIRAGYRLRDIILGVFFYCSGVFLSYRLSKWLIEIRDENDRG
jgi:hypothetical protein